MLKSQVVVATAEVSRCVIILHYFSRSCFNVLLSTGAEPYENVQQQSSKGTLDRFRKMMKTGAKVNKVSST